MKRAAKWIALMLSLIIVLSVTVPAFAVSDNELQRALTESAAYMVKTVANPQYGAIGGEWAVLGLARSGCAVPDGYYEDYYTTVENCVMACKGVLHAKKNTEYSRVIVALSAIGKDPTDVAGYNLLTPLGDYDKTIWQGLNGPIWALIALDSCNYPMPMNSEASTQATRQMYVDYILSCQLDDGGWNLTDKGGNGMSDTDMTGMALQALAKYTDQSAVKTAVDRALDCLSETENDNGGFANRGMVNVESCAQIIVALCELGVDLNEARFVNNGHTLLDNLLAFRRDGGFVHATEEGSSINQLSTEQGFYALAAAVRARNGRSSLYRMDDVITTGSGSDFNRASGLPGKHANVKPVPITAPGTSFEDVMYKDNITAIEALAARGIINGMGDGTFAPKKTMTRAEFAAIVVRALGLTPKANGKFADVTADKWYASYIGTANTYGIVNGTSDTEFNPDGTISRQEAATMTARAAKLCGMNTELSNMDILNALALFSDYPTVAQWAQGSMAFCYQEGILDDSAISIEPTEPILRCEIAQMLFNLLAKANLM